MNMHALFPLLAIAATLATAGRSVAAASPQGIPPTDAVERYIAIDNVCAWPNLTAMPDGSITAAIYSRPVAPGLKHGEEEGSIEVWGSADGRFWEKRGVAAPHDPQTNRLHAAAGLAKNGDLIVLSSGFSNIQQPGRPKQARFRDAGLPPWVCRSSDGGRTWTQLKEFATQEKGWSRFVPFGDIVVGTDGALHASAYSSISSSQQKKQYAWHLRSDDDGRTWRAVSVIGPANNETALLHLGGKKWLAAARSEVTRVIELFRSNDDGETWEGPQRVTDEHQLPGDLVRLKDGRLLLSYGDRIVGQFGVQAKLSSDEGRTWSAPIRLAGAIGRDCGYPSSLQRPDGKIVTAYYSASAENHTRYHMGVVIWTPPASNP